MLIKAQPLTSQHVLDELLKTELTPRGGIKRGSSCICVFPVRQLWGQKRSESFISFNQED